MTSYASKMPTAARARASRKGSPYERPPGDSTLLALLLGRGFGRGRRAAVHDLAVHADGHGARSAGAGVRRGRLVLRRLLGRHELRVAIPAVDVAVAGRVVADALQAIVIIDLPRVGLAVRAVGVPADPRELPVDVELPDVGSPQREGRIDVFLLDATGGEVDPVVDLAVVVGVRLFVE